MDSHAVLDRLRRLADEVDASPEIPGTGAQGLSDGPFLRELADGMEDAIAGVGTGPGDAPFEVIDSIARKITAA